MYEKENDSSCGCCFWVLIHAEEIAFDPTEKSHDTRWSTTILSGDNELDAIHKPIKSDRKGIWQQKIR